MYKIIKRMLLVVHICTIQSNADLGGGAGGSAVVPGSQGQVCYNTH